MELSQLEAGALSENQKTKITEILQGTDENENYLDNFIQIPILAADNLLSLSKSRWSLNVLNQMGKSYYGKSLMLNHDWDDVTSVKGVVFDTAFLSMTNLDKSTIDYLLEDSPDKKSDKTILQEEGYQALILWVAVEKGSGVAQDVKYLRLKNTSVGGSIHESDYICPICNVSFQSEECPHIIPDEMYLYMMDIDPKDSRVAPYMIWDGSGVLMYEVSFVYQGNNPRSRAIRSKDLKKLNIS